MASQGDFPFKSTYYRRRRERLVTGLVDSLEEPSSTVFNDFFFETPAATNPIKVKVGGVFTTLTASKVKVAGSFVSYTPKIKQGGVFA